jgi:hypothetical protein
MVILIDTELLKGAKANKTETESVAEFLARGGVIKVIPAVQPTVKVDSVKSTTSSGPAVIMTMDEADLYYGEFKARKPKKPVATIDISALPEALRKKYIDEVISGSKEDEKD